MKTIIVPVDFSKESIKGLRFAIPFARKFDANVEMVFVKKEEENIFSKDKEIPDDEIILKFNALKEEFIGQLGDQHKLDHIIKKGNVYKEVIRQSESHEASMIIMSTHGGSGFEELLMGSNAYKIASSSNRPVISVRGDIIPEDLNHIILPLDHTRETREKVPLTAMIADKFGATIHVVTVSSTEAGDIRQDLDNYQSQVCTWLKRKNISYETADLKGSNITDITIEYAEKVNADLISIMTEQEKSLQNILLGSYAHQMVNKSKIPVISFPTKQIGVLTESFKAEGMEYTTKGGV